MNQQGRPVSQGFTLVEMMVVVVIMGILAALASVGYGRYIGQARSSEAVAVLAEMASKEQLYSLEFASFLPLRSDNNIAMPSADEAAAAFYPVAADSGALESRRTATDISNAAGWPAVWLSVGLRPLAPALYCTYLTNAGNAGQAAPATYGAQLFATAGSTAAPWFYSLGACNLRDVAGYPGGDTVFAITSNSPSLRIFNEGE